MGKRLEFWVLFLVIPTVQKLGIFKVGNFAFLRNKWTFFHFFRSWKGLPLKKIRMCRCLNISKSKSFHFLVGQTKSIRPFPLMYLLPQNNLTQYYRYHGSLTTPPCSQVVLWTVYEVPIYISWAQVRRPKYTLHKYFFLHFIMQHNFSVAARGRYSGISINILLLRLWQSSS